jgi:nitroreductase
VNVIDALKFRKSIRGFKKDQVPKQLIHKVLEAAVRAPSGLNTQPWEFIVASGKTLDNIREECTKLFNEGAIPTYTFLHKPFEGVYRQRQVELGLELYRLMGIAREDKEKRKQWTLHGLRFFEAPCQIIIYTDKELEHPLDMIGIGSVCQSICLAALEYGLGTCIADQGIWYEQVWRKYANMPESKRLVEGISIGYPNDNFPANKLISKREAVDTITTWLGFD